MFNFTVLVSALMCSVNGLRSVNPIPHEDVPQGQPKLKSNYSFRKYLTKKYSKQNVLAVNQQKVYSLEELQKRPRPDGCDVCRLESYLSADEFQTVFGMDMDAFYALPKWKQALKKKEHSIF